MVVSREAWKEEVCHGFVLCRLFTNFVGAKVTPSGEYFLNCRFRFARSADREGLVSANSIVSLCVRSDKVISLFGPKESMYLVTVLTSQVSEYLG